MKKRPRAFHLTLEVIADAELNETTIREFVTEAVKDKIKTTHQTNPLSYATFEILSIRKIEPWR